MLIHTSGLILKSIEAPCEELVEILILEIWSSQHFLGFIIPQLTFLVGTIFLAQQVLGLGKRKISLPLNLHKCSVTVNPVLANSTWKDIMKQNMRISQFFILLQR